MISVMISSAVAAKRVASRSPQGSRPCGSALCPALHGRISALRRHMVQSGDRRRDRAGLGGRFARASLVILVRKLARPDIDPLREASMDQRTKPAPRLASLHPEPPPNLPEQSTDLMQQCEAASKH